MSSEPFDIKPQDLVEIMSKYKDRTTDFEDLKCFKEKKSISNILSSLKTDPERGITSTENREEFFGSNKIFVEPVPHFCTFVWDSLQDLMVRILIVAAIVSIVLGCTVSDNPKKDWIDGVSIVVAILVVVLVGSITEYQKETKFHELNKVQNKETKYKIIRNGQPEDAISDDLLVGDLIIINYGEIMAADILLIEGNSIKMDESALTGESDAMKKETYEKCEEILNEKTNKVPSPLILSGTNCIEGAGKGIVIAVGEYSQKGIIRRTVDNAREKSKTPLEEKLDKIAKIIGYFGIVAGIVTFITLFIRYMVEFSIEMKEYNKQKKENGAEGLSDPRKQVAKRLLNIIILCISIIVVAVPEGLPLAVTLSLAFSVKKLMEYNNLVRKMHACETMGGANFICTDKTGTLTKNQMSVFKILTGKNSFEIVQNREMDDVGKLDAVKKKNEEEQQIREDYTNIIQNEKYWNLIKTSIALNVDCVIKTLERVNINGDSETCDTKNKTDKAFIDFIYRYKSPISKERDKYLIDENSYKQFPFDSKKKRMTTFIKNPSFPSGYRLFSKGGGESALLYCRYYIDPDTGNQEYLDEAVSSHIKKKIEEFNKAQLRTLYVAYRDITEDEYNEPEKLNSEGKMVDQFDLVFLCAFGIRDSLRDNVKEAVKKCKEASVNVIMVTGDNIITATAIAKDCGILGSEVNFDGDEVEKNPQRMNDENHINKEKYIEKLIMDMPKALTGNSFYNVIGGLICENCNCDTNLCTCPKTESEAKQLAKKNNSEVQKVKKDKIKDMRNFMKITENLRVLARSQPIHKYALVLGLKELKNVVAVTGDGTNDAPALSKSDVGFAMFAGTDIAKEASDIIIIDNNFSSIVTAIIYGRNIYDNIRKFLQFQLSVNFCACILVFLCACIGNETPLTPIQMLWVNLIMDSLGSLALATEPPYEELLKRKPTKRNEFIINGKMCKHIALQSIAQIVLLILLYLFAPKFIKENNLVRLAENYLIEKCYEQFPGKNPKYIINGMESKWKSDIKLKSDINKDIFCGDYKDKSTLSQAFNQYIDSNSGTTHMVIIFNIFVFYTLFNQINCRVIDDSFNIFKRIQRSLFFPIITIFEMGLQVLIIFLGNSPFHIVDKGLTGYQWGICIGFSAITFVISIIAKCIPIDTCLDRALSPKEEQPVFDPLTPEIKDEKQNKIDDIIDIKMKNINEEETEEDIVSEKVNLNLLHYDFNNIDKSYNFDEEKKNNNDIIFPRVDISISDSKRELKNNNNDMIEEKSEPKIEEPSKKYKVANLGQNLLNLPENYSTDDEDEFKFINLMNEPNDSYDLAVDSKTIKVWAKIVSQK